MAALPKDTVVGIVGAGVMGAGIAQVAASAGYTVHLFDADADAAGAVQKSIGLSLNKLVSKGKLQTHEAGFIGARIKPVASLEDLKGAGLVIEAIVEDSTAKHELFDQIETLVKPDAIVATNTSSLSVTSLAAKLKHPARFVGLHFFNPAALMPLVEVVEGIQTAAGIGATLLETMAAWGKEPILVNDAPGFVVNRGARCFYGEPLKFLEEQGADAATTDDIMKSLGFRMGPLELIDFIGLDINLAASKSMFDSSFGEPRYKPSSLVEQRVTANQLGKKSGKGFYDYPSNEGSKPKYLGPAKKPEAIEVYGEIGSASPLSAMARAAGIEVDRGQGDGHIMIGTLRITPTDGRMAAERGEGWATFDLNLDWESATTVAIAAAPNTDITAAVGLFQGLGKQVVQVADLPGMLAAKTICMLINEACETLQKGIAKKDDIDLAMKKGLNWPGGPFEWLEKLGADYCVKVLDNMARNYGDPRYRASITLRQMALMALPPRAGEVSRSGDGGAGAKASSTK